ncbi:MAG: hypothetical protein QXW56_03295 [Nitrososphaerota archaeon]
MVGRSAAVGLLIAALLAVFAEPASSQQVAESGTLLVEPLVARIEERWGAELLMSCELGGGTVLRLRVLAPYVELHPQTLSGWTERYVLLLGRNGTARFRAELSVTSEAPDASVTVKRVEIWRHRFELQRTLRRGERAELDLVGGISVLSPVERAVANSFGWEEFSIDLRLNYSYAGISGETSCESYWSSWSGNGGIRMPASAPPVRLELRASPLRGVAVPYRIVGGWGYRLDLTGSIRQIAGQILADLTVVFGADASDIEVQLLDSVYQWSILRYVTIGRKGYIRAGESLRIRETLLELGAPRVNSVSGQPEFSTDLDERLAMDRSAPLYLMFPILVAFTDPWTGRRHTSEPVFLLLRLTRMPGVELQGPAPATATGREAASGSAAAPSADWSRLQRLGGELERAAREVMPLVLLAAALLGGAYGMRAGARGRGRGRLNGRGRAMR